MKRLFIASLILTLTGCSSSKQLSSLGSLVQNPWQLTELMGNSDFSSLFGQTIPFLNFAENGSVSGSDGCNNIMGSISPDVLSSGKIDLGKIASTQMACKQDGPNLFNKMLKEAKKFNFSGDLLNFMDENGNKLASFSPKIQ